MAAVSSITVPAARRFCLFCDCHLSKAPGRFARASLQFNPGWRMIARSQLPPFLAINPPRPDGRYRHLASHNGLTALSDGQSAVGGFIWQSRRCSWRRGRAYGWTRGAGCCGGMRRWPSLANKAERTTSRTNRHHKATPRIVIDERLLIPQLRNETARGCRLFMSR
jgi:hypothetical protein